MTTRSFNEWIGLNADRLRERISANTEPDEDAFQDACLFMAETFGAERVEDREFEQTFMAAYRRFRHGNLREMIGTCRPDEAVMTLLAGGGEESEDERNDEREELVRRIVGYMRRKFSGRQVMVFEMKLYGFRDRDIEESMGITRAGVHYVTRTITGHLRRRFALTRKEKKWN